MLTESNVWGDGGNEDVQSLQMSFTIDLAPYPLDKTYILPFNTLGTTGDYTLIVNWGDGSEMTIIPSGSSLVTIISHIYPETKEYQITISTTEASIFVSCFGGCSGLTEIPANLFAANRMGIKFDRCFQFCSGLTGEIPANLFATNTKVTSFAGCFYGCSKLAAIPSGLFDKNVLATRFDLCFALCSGLTGSIPAGLFAFNAAAYNFTSCFASCKRLTVTPNIFCDEATTGAMATRFANLTNKVVFNSCFSDCGSLVSTQTAPALWNYTYGSGYNSFSCFGNGTNFSNSIPSGW